ncbi:glutamine--fructose-6-phosphate transaminase (isomerizing) [Nocardioides mesophilus]|uniref:Glutamine--fructose-6-phosphate aminotransferase [isomerizing] n=1 Tax=Nocardioides mesophilus TaxID=433659 RepID=A0A7G9R9B4_9ACTN|nr:glutamine--fructose-6-phosphate transaminase (isomerizing) [Nocardioides mesophilus]QNN52189.1 glutamine--fructose-6-phosphate transaminase (isomerizing) [Nocardioides mesophilus]
MCGIVGYVGRRPVTPLLLEGLGRLEYRGYDSAGVAVLEQDGAEPASLLVHKVAGRVRDLAAALPVPAGPADQDTADAAGSCRVGIGHTRWATHGAPTDANAHPHVSHDGHVAVVHNGIVDNAAALRAELQAAGVELRSETDTEVLAHLVAQCHTGSLEEAVLEALSRVQGTYGLAVIDVRHPDRLVVARNGSPLIIGIGDGEMHVASDVSALVRYTRQVVHVDDGELATLTADGFRTFTRDVPSTGKQAVTVEWEDVDFDQGDHDHFMVKEIHEQPEAVRRCLRGRLDERFHTAHLGGLELDAREMRAIRRVKILGCGSAYYAGQLGAQLIEEVARIPADAEPASEFRYRNPVIDPETLYVAVSQSGETYDTLAAVQEIKRKGGRVIGLVNVVGSTIARECCGGIYLHAGPEVAVASTKALTNMSVGFALLGIHLGRIRDLSPANGQRLLDGLAALPAQIEEVFESRPKIADAAGWLATASSLFFVGRVRGFPVAREGAQKLKEVSYLHAEAYQTSELKHGPLALISPELPTVAIVPDDELLDRNLTALHEIGARSGPLMVITHQGVDVGELATSVIEVPRNEPELDPILLTIPLQLLAYEVSVQLGRDIDKPRNLAKSVTVE